MTIVSQELLPVIQADREAAAEFAFSPDNFKPDPKMRLRWNELSEALPLVQAFARHRINSAKPTDAGVQVNPLRWSEPHPSHTYPNWMALDINIGFEARIDTSRPLMFGKFPLAINGHTVNEKFETVEDAKAYAQSNYAERILAALSTPPSSEDISDTLIERLRRKDNWTQHKPYWHERNPDGPEAAAEIERLRAALATKGE